VVCYVLLCNTVSSPYLATNIQTSHKNIQTEYLVQMENFHYFMSKFMLVKYFNFIMYLEGTCKTELTVMVYQI
jgi:hypothetical protein